MPLIKKLDFYIFKKFIGIFMMTFMIVIFILLLQFLWKHFADLAGKGVGWNVFAEFFWYASLTLVSMALPLALLLASLMTFGNLGENFELNAMKSSGISLSRIIRPLVILVAVFSISAFYFSNTILPKAQTKLWTLVLSLKQKSPELEIPVGEFYKGISGVNLYVREKEQDLLKNLMIYDFSEGFNNATVVVADSGRISITDDKKYLLLVLFNGESFENLKDQRQSGLLTNIPYNRETFGYKELLLDFDSDFNRFDETLLEDHNVSKNLKQLQASIDSVTKIIDQRGNMQSAEMVNHRYFGRETNASNRLPVISDSLSKAYDNEKLYNSLNSKSKLAALELSVQKASTMKDQLDYNQILMGENLSYVNRHLSEWHRKFTLSFACLIFFFIGAPLGSIIRKGGFGAPIVISVIMFIIYYIIDTTGYKMAREGLWHAFQGMWLSSFVLLPLGVFLTYKATVDATLFNPEQYSIFIKNLRTRLNSVLKLRNSSKI